MDPEGAPSVTLRGVTKRCGDFAAVRDMDLDIARGEFFTMLGPSGCGKTMSVEKNVALGLERQSVSREEVRARVGEELERVGLQAEANRKPRQLSGGQQQRVALARALVNRPAVLLLDEPLGALDLKLRKQLQVELKRIQQDVGITFVYVTYDQEEALTMPDRIAVMNRGVVEQLDHPEEIYERPRHVMFNLSFVIVTVRSRLIGFDRSLEEAAQDLGAQTFRLITLPLIMPGVLSAALLAFALSIDDFVITNFVSGTTITFPVFIWGAARVAVAPQIYVIASMIFLFTLAMMLLTVWQQRRAERMAAVRPDEPEASAA